MNQTRKNNLFAAAVVMTALALSAACNSGNDVTNPPGGGGTVGGTVDLDVTASTLANGVTNISGGDNPTIASSLENAGVDTRVQVTATTSDGYQREVLVYFTTATGAVFHVTYSWGLASLLENIVHCDAAETACTGATVNTATRTISLAAVPLDNTGASGPGSAPTETATMGMNPPASQIEYLNP